MAWKNIVATIIGMFVGVALIKIDGLRNFVKNVLERIKNKALRWLINTAIWTLLLYGLVWLANNILTGTPNTTIPPINLTGGG